MTLSAHTAQSILEYIASAGTMYDEIINNIIAPNYHQKDALISELAISFLTNEDKVNEVLRQGYFNYYFIRAVKNQVHSSTSSFHKNNRAHNVYDVPVGEYEIEDEKDDLEYKKLVEEQNEMLKNILNNMKVSWFEKEIFNMYYNEDYTYRQIEAEYEIDHCLAFTVIKKIREKIKKEVKSYEQ